MTRQEFEASLNLEESLIPEGKKNRPGTAIVPKFITIHNTDNTNKGADARMHAKFLMNAGFYMLNGQQHWVSWHYTVDDKCIIKHLPLNEKAFHAVNGNSQSLGIEICMNQGIDQPRAFLNAARLTALLLFDLQTMTKDVRKVVPHKFWTGKDCPRLLLDNGNLLGAKWQGFLNTVQQELSSITGEPEDLHDPAKIATMEQEPFDLSIIQDASTFHVDEYDVLHQSNGSVPVEKELYAHMAQVAQKRGVNIETLANLWLEQKLNENMYKSR